MLRCPGKCWMARVSVAVVERALCAHAGDLSKEMPLTDTALSEAIDGVDAELFHASSDYEYQKHVLAKITAERREIPNALLEQMTETDAKLEKLSAELRELRRKYGQTETRYVTQRAEHMAAMLKPYVLNPAQIPAANTALRECFSRVVMDAHNGTVEAHWRHGGDRAGCLRCRRLYPDVRGLGALNCYSTVSLPEDSKARLPMAAAGKVRSGRRRSGSRPIRRLAAETVCTRPRPGPVIGPSILVVN
jgi:hypothetical protein